MPLPKSDFQRNHQGMPSLPNKILLRLVAGRLDADLAAGLPPETSPRHAARARLLVNPRSRQALATNWEHLLLIAHAPPSRRRSGHIPVERQRIHRAEPEIRELIAALRASGPIPARGVAIAADLLTDGLGPVYNPRSGDDLTAAIVQAVEQLDPTLPLSPDRFASPIS